MSHVKSEPGANPIVVEGHYPVSPDKVFKAWTQPEVVEQWFGATSGGLESATVDLRPGGRWRFTEQTDERMSTFFEGEYLDVSPYDLLLFTWSKVTIDHEIGERDATPTSTVEIRLAEDRHGTFMRITHSNLDLQSRIGFRYGWTSGIDKLTTLLTLGRVRYGGSMGGN